MKFPSVISAGANGEAALCVCVREREGPSKGDFERRGIARVQSCVESRSLD